MIRGIYRQSSWSAADQEVLDKEIQARENQNQTNRCLCPPPAFEFKMIENWPPIIRDNREVFKIYHLDLHSKRKQQSRNDLLDGSLLGTTLNTIFMLFPKQKHIQYLPRSLVPQTDINTLQTDWIGLTFSYEAWKACIAKALSCSGQPQFVKHPLDNLNVGLLKHWAKVPGRCAISCWFLIPRGLVKALFILLEPFALFSPATSVLAPEQFV